MAKAILATVIRQAASLLNAAGWQMSAFASITAASGALTMSDAALTADDVGKSIAIDGAGTGGTIYVGTITAVGSGTTCTISPVAGTTVASACASYGGKLEDDRHNLLELREAAIEADDEVYITLGETPQHWARSDVTTATSLTHGAKLPAHVGDVTAIMIKADAADDTRRSRPAGFETIERYRANTGTAPNDVYGSYTHTDSNSPLAAFHHIDGADRFFFAGSEATGDMLLYTDPRTSNTLNSPASLTGVVVYGAARRMYKQGAIDAYFGAFSNIAQAGLAGIRANSRNVPDPAAFEMPQAA